MAISPTVAAYQQQADQQFQQPGDADSLFRQSFQDQAFNTLRAKAASLIPYVVTFKIFDANVDDGDAFGVFAITSGTEVSFIPVVMDSGSITSCEMLYNRAEDRMEPLLDETVQRIVSQNNATPPKMLEGGVNVENTRNLFRNLVRPPQSSNVIYAASRPDIGDLPDRCKEKVAEYFEKHPMVLKKIAEFYPVELLASKLKPELKKQASSREAPSIVKKENLSKFAAEQLTDYEKARINTCGWFVKRGAEEGNAKQVFDIDKLPEELDKYFIQTDSKGFKPIEHLFQQFKFDQTATYDRCAYSVGLVVRNSKNGVPATLPCIKIGPVFYFDGEEFYGGSNAVLSYVEPASRQDLIEHGFTSFEKIKASITDVNAILVPRKNGTYTDAGFGRLIKENIKASFENVDGDWVVQHGSGNTSLTFTKRLQFGCFKGKSEAILPRKTLVLVSTGRSEADAKRHFTPIATLSDLYNNILRQGTVLRVVSDGVSKTITDSREEKTASFVSEGAAAEHLFNKYALNQDQIDTVLSQPKSLILTKLAVGELMAGAQPMPPQQMVPQQAQQPMQMAPQQVMQAPPQQPMPPQGQPPQQVSLQSQQALQQNMPAAAAMGDPEMIDAGVLASFAGEPDVKAMLVDYYPDFISILDRIGRTILIFCLQKKEFVKYYKEDKVENMLLNLRKVFKIIGDLAQSLRLYINMAGK